MTNIEFFYKFNYPTPWQTLECTCIWKSISQKLSFIVILITLFKNQMRKSQVSIIRFKNYILSITYDNFEKNIKMLK